jgi:hypothetical protein
MASTDLSDIRPAITPEVSPNQLPIRGEKRIIPVTLSPSQVQAAFSSASSRKFANTGRTTLVQASDFNTVAALEPYVDYVIIRMLGRGTSANGIQAANTPPATYRFLINPSQVSVQRATLDVQAMTRAGWQIGVWGEDAFMVQLTGKTAGQYFAFGTTDAYQPFTESYRNLQQLQVVFENNGYWFEGEQAAEGPLAAGFTRRRIKMHSDVELIVGNFIWQGMFDTLTIQQDADAPFLLEFQLSFLVWKERFRNGSPYQNLITNNIERGHSYLSWASTATAAQNGIPNTASSNPANSVPPTSSQTANVSPNPPNAQVVSALAGMYGTSTQDIMNSLAASATSTPPVVLPPEEISALATYYNTDPTALSNAYNATSAITSTELSAQPNSAVVAAIANQYGTTPQALQGALNQANGTQITSPTVAAAQQSSLLPTTDPTTYDFSPAPTSSNFSALFGSK